MLVWFITTVVHEARQKVWVQNGCIGGRRHGYMDEWLREWLGKEVIRKMDERMGEREGG